MTEGRCGASDLLGLERYLTWGIYGVGWLILALGGSERVLALIEAGDRLSLGAMFAEIAEGLTLAVAPGVLVLGFGALLSLVRHIAVAAETARRGDGVKALQGRSSDSA